MSISEEQFINLQPFFQVMHVALHRNDTLAECKRTSSAMKWVMEDNGFLEHALHVAQLQIVDIIREHFRAYGKCPTRQSLKALVEVKPDAKLLQNELLAYDKIAMQSESIDPKSQAACAYYLLRNREAVWEMIRHSSAKGVRSARSPIVSPTSTAAANATHATTARHSDATFVASIQKFDVASIQKFNADCTKAGAYFKRKGALQMGPRSYYIPGVNKTLWAPFLALES